MLRNLHERTKKSAECERLAVCKHARSEWTTNKKFQESNRRATSDGSNDGGAEQPAKRSKLQGDLRCIQQYERKEGEWIACLLLQYTRRARSGDVEAKALYRADETVLMEHRKKRKLVEEG